MIDFNSSFLSKNDLAAIDCAGSRTGQTNHADSAKAESGSGVLKEFRGHRHCELKKIRAAQ